MSSLKYKIWKFVVLICLGIIIGILFCKIGLAQPPEFNIGYIKWALCDDFNLTKWTCDAWWESPNNPYYAQEKSESNLSLMMGSYYNKTDVYNKTEILLLVTSNQIAENLTNQTINLTGYYSKTEIDEKFKSILINQSDKYADRDDFLDLEREVRGDRYSSGISDGTILLVLIIVIIAVISILVYNSKKQKKTGIDYEGEVAQERLHRIKGRREMELEEENKRLKDKKRKGE